MRMIVLVLAAVLLAGCRSNPAPDIAFDVKEASVVHAKGKTRIEGHAFLTSRGGKVLSAAGEPIHLVPATAYARARVATIYGDRRFVPAWKMARMEAPP